MFKTCSDMAATVSCRHRSHTQVSTLFLQLTSQSTQCISMGCAYFPDVATIFLICWITFHFQGKEKENLNFGPKRTTLLWHRTCYLYSNKLYAFISILIIINGQCFMKTIYGTIFSYPCMICWDLEFYLFFPYLFIIYFLFFYFYKLCGGKCNPTTSIGDFCHWIFDKF